jgi:hypothetical protein
MRRFLRENGLSVFFAGLFLFALVGQAVAGKAEFNSQQVVRGLDAVSLLQYIATSDFAVDVTENWQSEYLQFLLYICATVWLVQRGSPESKELGKSGPESDEDQMVGAHAKPDSPLWARVGGARTAVYSNSLALIMGALFLLSWLTQSIAGWSAYNQRQLGDLQPSVSWPAYLVSPEFWSRTLQNWQSEFLAVGSMTVLSIYLRQRGSPESKPVGETHDSTGVTG